MTRAEAIAIIESAIATADDAALEAAAQLLRSTSDDDLPRPLTPAELASIEQAREDFRTGRTYTPEQLRASLDQALAARRATRAKV